MDNAKVLIFSTAKSGTGVAQFNEHIGAALLEDRREVVIAQPEESDYQARMGEIADVERRYFSKDPYDDITAFGGDRFLAAALLVEIRPDLVVISNGFHPLASVACMQAAHFFRIPYVTVDGLVAPSLYSWEDNIVNMVSGLYRNAAAVIVKSRANLETLRQCLRLPAEVGSVIVSGRPETYFQPRNPTLRSALRAHLGIPIDGVLCLTAAKLEIVKGHSLQIEAMKRLKERAVWDRLHFIWAGEGEERANLEAALDAAGVADRVNLIGHRTDIADWMDAADCCVLTSHSEGIPLSVMEAMAKGLPVVATTVGGTAEALGDTGIPIARPALMEDCINGLVDALDRVASDDAVRCELGAACRARAEKHFRLERMLDDYRAVFDKSLKRPESR